jgi:hypothetical protein
MGVTIPGYCVRCSCHTEQAIKLIFTTKDPAPRKYYHVLIKMNKTCMNELN